MNRTVLLSLALITAFAVESHAQDLQSVAPGGVQKHSEDVLEYLRLQKKLKKPLSPPEKGEVEDRTAQPEAAPPEDMQRIAVTRIETDRSEILSPEEIRGITSAYEGKGLSIRELFEMVEKINGLYREKRIITARAVLPPQKVEGGVVRIRLVEGHVGTVRVEGNSHTRESFVADRISLKRGEIVRLDLLENDLTYFNSTNDVKLKAELKPGGKTGETDLVLRAEEPRNYRASVLFDNAGRETVGRERVGVRLADLSLFGIRDPLVIGGYFAEGTLSGSVSYSLPLNRFGTRFSVNYDYNQIEVREGPFSQLDVGGDSYSTGFNLSHPLVVRPVFTLNLFSGYQYKLSSTDFGGVLGSRTKVGDLSYGFDLQLFDSSGLWYNRHTFTNGMTDLGGDMNFFKYLVDLNRTQVLTRDVLAIVRATAQISDTKQLTSSEQFQLGGLASVRGYSEGLLSGDDGYFVGAEVNFPLPFTGSEIWGTSLREKVKGALFVDHGGAFPYKGSDGGANHRDYLTSGGFGLILNWSQYLTGRIDFGVPFDHREQDQDEVQFHFYLQMGLL
jgi:hemolysin activation/secretion protein